MAARTGFEPAILCVTGRWGRPTPLTRLTFGSPNGIRTRGLRIESPVCWTNYTIGPQIGLMDEV